MKKILIEGEPYLKGNDIVFEPRPLYGLEIGSQVKSIGIKTKSAFSRQDVFSPYVIYSGVFTINEDEMMAFEIHPSTITGFSLFNPPERLYKLYTICEHDGKAIDELIISHYHNLTNRIFKTVFNNKTTPATQSCRG